MKLRQILSCATLLSVALYGASASAGVILSFAPSTPAPLTAGSSGTIDVMIQSDAVSSAPVDTLDFFQVKLSLTPLALSPSGGLQFSTLQLDAQLPDPNYVFNSGSLAFNTSASVGTSTGSTYSGSDQTDDGFGGAMPVGLTSIPQLLFRLNLDALLAGTYSIDLDRSLTQFSSDQFDPVNTSLLFSSTAGTITVNGVTAVPEPSGAIILGLLFAVGICVHLRGKKSPELGQHDELFRKALY